MDVGKRITALRTAKGWTTNHLANRCGISQSFLRAVELGERAFLWKIWGCCARPWMSPCGIFSLPRQRRRTRFSVRSAA